MTKESDDLFAEIMKGKPKEVELMISKIDKMLEKEILKEEYEDCARFRDMKEPFNKFLSGELEYKDIKEDLEFAQEKFGDLISDALAKAKKKK